MYLGRDFSDPDLRCGPIRQPRRNVSVATICRRFRHPERRNDRSGTERISAFFKSTALPVGYGAYARVQCVQLGSTSFNLFGGKDSCWYFRFGGMGIASRSTTILKPSKARDNHVSGFFKERENCRERGGNGSNVPEDRRNAEDGSREAHSWRITSWIAVQLREPPLVWLL